MEFSQTLTKVSQFMDIVISGARGKMGKVLLACVPDYADIKVAGQIYSGDGDGADCVRSGEVVVDFSFHSGTPKLVKLCVQCERALVIGTTGHSEAELATIKNGAEKIPIVFASNYSTGVNVLFWLTCKAAEVLGPSFDIEIVEMHHRLKRDAPSGTAHTLAKILAQTRGRRLDEVIRNGRAGIVGPRTSEEVGVHSLRGGDVVGEHTVIFAGEGERVELTHKASSRETFARGALRAAEWVVKQRAGLYSMAHVLGLPD